MAKQKLIIRDFSGGMNTKRDPRDIADNESSYMNNFSIDAIGKLKTAGGFYDHIESNDGSTNLTEYISNTNFVNLKDFSDATINAGGFGAFYFESDHGLSNEQTITETISGTVLAIGTGDGQISFNKVSTKEDEPPYIPVTNTE
tara:strand:- start:33085 stop:33516 length:432 start_codon:yes stop_codon:yes gene_type:complete